MQPRVVRQNEMGGKNERKRHHGQPEKSVYETPQCRYGLRAVDIRIVGRAIRLLLRSRSNKVSAHNESIPDGPLRAVRPNAAVPEDLQHVRAILTSERCRIQDQEQPVEPDRQEDRRRIFVSVVHDPDHPAKRFLALASLTCDTRRSASSRRVCSPSPLSW